MRNETDGSPAPVPPRESGNADTSEDEADNAFFRHRAATRTVYVLIGPSLISINVCDVQKSNFETE